MYKILQITIIIILLLICLTRGYQDQKDCRKGETGKKPGHAYRVKNFKASGGLPDLQFNVQHFKNCSSICSKNLHCQLAEFTKRNGTCNIYYTIPNVKSDDLKEHDVFYWMFCNLKRGTDKKESAKGFWFYYKHSKKDGEHFQTFHGNFIKCKSECRKNPLCGGFNFHKKNKKCKLLILWKEGDVRPAKGWRGYYWVLQSPIKYNVHREHCRNIINKRCIGKWIMRTKNNITTPHVLLKYKTRNFFTCYRSCELHYNCKYTIFQYSTSTCILKPIHITECVKEREIPEKDTVSVEWKCCYHNYLIESPHRTMSLPTTRTCHNVSKPQYLTLVPFTCSYPPPDIFETCTSKRKSHSITCYKNQCFQSTNKMIDNYLIIFNGYQSFLLKNASFTNFPVTTQYQCKLFNAEIPKHPTIHLTSSKEWYSSFINETFLHMRLPAWKIIVEGLKHDYCLCITWVNCVEILLRYQKKCHQELKINIPYHFIISGKGNVFEGRGWTRQTLKFTKYGNSHTLFIAFLGDYSKTYPTISSMKAFKNLIKYGVTKKYIAENYMLLTLDDYHRKHNTTYWKLYNVIRTQARYGNLHKEDCIQISIKTIISNIICISLFSFIIAVSSSMFYRWGHSKDCKLFKTFNIKENLLNIIILPLTEGAEDCIHRNGELNDFIKEENWTANVSNLTMFWISQMTEQFPCSNFSNTLLQTFLVFKHRNRLIKLSEMKMINCRCKKESLCLVFQKHSAMLQTILVFVHLSKTDISSKLKGIISSAIHGKCICSNYKISFLNLNSKESLFQSF